jgi:hypothetical protein
MAMKAKLKKLLLRSLESLEEWWFLNFKRVTPYGKIK